MNVNQASGIMEILTAAFAQRPVSTATLMIYQRCIMDLDFEDAKAAVLDLVTEADWLPSIAAIRKAALALTDDTPTAAEAWDEVNRAFRNCGSWAVPEWSDRLVEKTVAGMGGWKVLCASENAMADRAHFLTAYRIEAERARFDRVRLPEARQLEAKARERLATGNVKRLEG